MSAHWQDNSWFWPGLITVSQSPAFLTSNHFQPTISPFHLPGCISMFISQFHRAFWSFWACQCHPPSSRWHLAHATCHRRGSHAQHLGDDHLNLPSLPRSSTAWRMHRGYPWVTSSWLFETPRLRSVPSNAVMFGHLWWSLIILLVFTGFRIKLWELGGTSQHPC